MSAYLVAVYRCTSRANAEVVRDNFDPGDFADNEHAVTIHDTPPVVLSGLVKGGECASVGDFVEHIDPSAVLYLDTAGRVATEHTGLRALSYPLTWYRYEEQ